MLQQIIASAVVDYSKDRVEGEINPLYLSKTLVCFGDHQKYFSISDKTGSLLEHLLLSQG